MKKTEFCPISQNPMKPVFTGIILGKYSISYYFCDDCGILKTESAYWLGEAYQSAIGDTDTGLVQRNILNSKWLEVILYHLYSGAGKFLDVSGGYGLLARLMRDKGFDFFTTDKYCKNLFANHFEPTADFNAEALCAFEVLEHVENPHQFLNEIFTKYNCKTLVFSTQTFANDQIPKDDWWYYSFETGQHITFYQPRTLECLSKSLGLNYYMLSSCLHIFTDKKLSTISKIILSNSFIQKIYSLYINYKRKGISKTWDDHTFIRDKL